MWHAARQQEKKIKELMVDHKKRAERRRAYYESRLGDPSQLLRLTGTATKLFPNAEQHYFYENSEKSLMQWQGDAETRIDRFDGRALLDYLPPDNPNLSILPTDERDLQEELNFERFRDLVENERRNVPEDCCLEEIEAEWTSLLERHKIMIKKLQEKPDTNNQGFGYDYGTEKQDEIPSDEESHHLDEEDILDYVDDLTDKDRQTLNIMGKKYQIPDYTRLLRIAKRDREEKAQELKESQKIKERKSRRHISRKEEHNERSHVQSRSYSIRDSPTYEPYTDSDSSTSFSDEQEVGNFVIEFGNPEEDASESSSTRPHGLHKEELSLVQLQRGSLSYTRKTETLSSQKALINTNIKVPPKKLTPAEKLRLKLQMGLNKQIQVDEKKKIQKEREQKFERLGSEEIEKQLIKSVGKKVKRSVSREHYRKTSVKSKSSRTRYRRDRSSSVDSIRTSKRRRRRSRSTSYTSSSSRSRTRSSSSSSGSSTSSYRSSRRHSSNRASSHERRYQRQRSRSRSTSPKERYSNRRKRSAARSPSRDSSSRK